MCSWRQNHLRRYPQSSKLPPSNFPYSMPQGVCQVVLIASLQHSLPCILISFERINTNTSPGYPHQLVSFVAHKTNFLYVLDYVLAQCNQSVVNCFSIVMHVHLGSSNLHTQIFKHLTWPIVSVNFNIIMLHFVLFHNVTSYTTFLLPCVLDNAIQLRNIMCTLVATCVTLQSLECSKQLDVLFIRWWGCSFVSNASPCPPMWHAT